MWTASEYSDLNSYSILYISFSAQTTTTTTKKATI
jgi:hypothetical protein